MIRVKNRNNSRRGAAVVELAAVLPFLMFLSVIATDWARLFYYTITVESCARNGALYSSDSIAQIQSSYSNVQEAAMAEAPDLNAVATVNAASTTDSAGNAAVIVTVSVPFQTLSNFPGVPSAETLTRSVQMRSMAVTIR